jgi:hypothetical protein
MPRYAWRFICVAAYLSSVGGAAAQTATEPPPTVYNGRAGATAVTVPRLDAVIRVDGSLDEAAWHAAALLTGFSQYLPVDRLAAADSTEVYVFYTATAIYFGIRAFEPHGAVQATLAERDRVQGDDHIDIILDTFNDGRRALLFSVNALGVQADGIVTDGTESRGSSDVRSLDFSPDFVFESYGRITTDGYEVEVRIPFRSLRFPSDGVQTWGLNIVRRVQHSGHAQSWTPVERNRPSFLAQSGTLEGLTGFDRGLVLDVNPVITARRAGRRQSDGRWRQDATDPEFGMNVRWGVTSNLTTNATLNPDFSHVESDVGQVVYDPRQAVFFAEKRPFFLDASEHYDAPNRLIYTRRIGQPIGAVKLSGRAAGTSIGLLAALDDRAYSDDGATHPVVNVVRVRRDVAAHSTLGLVYTDRVVGTDWNRVAAADARIVFGGAYTLSAQVGSSFTEIGGTSAHLRPIFDASLVRSTRESGFSASLRGTHPEFRADAGFINRTGIVHARLGPRRNWYPGGRVESLQLGTFLDGTWSYDRFRAGREPNDLKWHVSANSTWRGGWRVTGFTFIESFLYPAELYHDYFIERRDPTGAVLDTVPYTGTHRLPNLGGLVSVALPQFARFAADIQLIGGRDDNFEEWSSAWVLFTTANLDWRPNDRIRVNGRYLEQRFHRYSDGSLVKLQWIPRMKLEYQVSRPVFVRFIGEYNAAKRDALRDDSRTNDPILLRQPDGSFTPATAQQRSRLRADALFAYQPTPGTVIFAGYGGTLAGEQFFEPRALRRAEEGVFVKVSYLWRL